MKSLGGRGPYLLWLVVVLLGAGHLLDKSEQVRPEIHNRARLVSSLERVVVAARNAAKEGPVTTDRVVSSLLAHGIQTRAVRSSASRDEIRLGTRLGPDDWGEVEIWTGLAGKRIVTAWAGDGVDRIELSALLLGTDD